LHTRKQLTARSGYGNQPGSEEQPDLADNGSPVLDAIIPAMRKRHIAHEEVGIVLAVGLVCKEVRIRDRKCIGVEGVLIRTVEILAE
jgi:hypothetical protein